MTIEQMWDLYEVMERENSKHRHDMLEIINSMNEIYESGWFDGLELSQKLNSGTCFVYFVSCGELLKIGVTDNVPKRAKQLQTGSPYELEILHVIPFNSRKDAFKKESELHKKYSAFRVNGEWFTKIDVMQDMF